MFQRPLKRCDLKNHSHNICRYSLIQAGLRIDFFNEYPFSTDKEFEFSEKDSEGYYRLKNQKVEIPLLFTLKASKWNCCLRARHVLMMWNWSFSMWLEFKHPSLDYYNHWKSNDYKKCYDVIFISDILWL